MDIEVSPTQAAIDSRDRRIAELEAALIEQDRVAALLTEAEQKLALIPALKLQIEDLQHELTGVRTAYMHATSQVRELEERLLRDQQTMVDVMNSPSWRLTRPLRDAKKLLGR